MAPRPHILLAVLLVLPLAEARTGTVIVRDLDGGHPTGPVDPVGLTGVKPVTAEMGQWATDPRWSPDGARLAFRYGGGIGVVAVGGQTELRKYPVGGVNPLGFCWSHDGASIYFKKTEHVRSPKPAILHSLKRIDLASGRVLTLDDQTQHGAFPYAFPGGVAYRDSSAGGAVFLRSDGRRADDDFMFVFTGEDFSICVARRSGISRIASADGPDRGYLWPSLSPAEDRVAFVVMQTGIGVVNVDGSALHILYEGDDASSPSWHPSGRWILFQRTVDGEWDVAASDLYVVSSASAELRQLTDTPGLVELNACFSPDGSSLAFQSNESIYVGEVVGQ